ncbi:MAG: NAD(P)/FAD-dependent oxidoreductase [Lachnospiraceae bacterium]|nr:NAD(P)/FAD-dependent oxidoreductase [Lachnospiraceae bacterium]
MNRVAIIGGGAAGMAAAIGAAQTGLETHLYEKNEKLGKKLYITGKGRCNVTNACETEELFTNMVTNGKFLYSAVYGFTNFDMMSLLELCGCPLKVERGGRVFPVSDKASDVTAALEKRLKSLHVKIHLNEPVKGLAVGEGGLKGIILKNKNEIIETKSVIVATGGLSYPATGSTGDGYHFAKEAGHTLTPLLPALVPFNCAEQDVQALQGLSLRNVEITVKDGKRIIHQEFGEILFTHFGISGPVTLSASSFAAKAIRERPLVMDIDLKPALSREQLDARLLRDFEEAKNRQFKNSLSRLFPAKLIPVMVERSGIDPDKVNGITAGERERLLMLTKAFRVTLTSPRGFGEAIVTQGGVQVKEINPHTMESKKLPGLYFAGEVLDLDGVTGGFNLQIAWSTGMLAGQSVGQNPSG